MAKIDMIGKRYGKWIVVGEAAKRKKLVYMFVQCDCGNERQVERRHLLNGRSKSCGCGRASHGCARDAGKSPEYTSWAKMIQRCTNPNHWQYHNYGGRGITVCSRWKLFVNFLEDMGCRPTAGHSIDRIDNDGNYEPGNCRWATRLEQNRNKRTNKLITFHGETLCLLDWANRIGITHQALSKRIDKWGLERALTTAKQDISNGNKR